MQVEVPPFPLGSLPFLPAVLPIAPLPNYGSESKLVAVETRLLPASQGEGEGRTS